MTLAIAAKILPTSSVGDVNNSTLHGVIKIQELVGNVNSTVWMLAIMKFTNPFPPIERMPTVFSGLLRVRSVHIKPAKYSD